MLFKKINLNPKHLVITQGIGGETNPFGNCGTAFFNNGIDTIADFFFRSRMITVPGFWPDNMTKLNALFFQIGFHDISSLLLIINLAAISNNWKIGEVDGPIRAIIPMKQLLFPSIGGDDFFLKYSKEIRGFRKTSTRSCCGPSSRVMHCKLPACCTAHRETANHNTVAINRIIVFNMIHCFDAIYFACELIGATISAIQLQHHAARRNELARTTHHTFNKVQLRKFFPSAMAPEIKPALAISHTGVISRDSDAIGLNRIINFGTITTNNQTGSSSPRRFTFGKRLSTIHTQLQVFLGDWEFLGIVKFVVGKSVANAVMKDFNIWKKLYEGFSSE